MNFEEWYAKTYDPHFGKEHKEWERKAWDASKENVVSIIIDMIELIEASIPQDNPNYVYELSDDRVAIMALEDALTNIHR